MQMPGDGKSAFARQISESSTVASLTQERCDSHDSEAESAAGEPTNWLKGGVCRENWVIAINSDGIACFVDTDTTGDDAEKPSGDAEEAATEHCQSTTDR